MWKAILCAGAVGLLAGGLACGSMGGSAYSHGGADARALHAGDVTQLLSLNSLLSPGKREPRYVSLLIGIGDYEHPHFRLLDGGIFASRLDGTTNDVRRIQRSLRGWGFAEGPDHRVLLDAQATKRGIADAFRWLAERADQPDDIVVIYYSGHGSWAPDSAIDEVRIKDEDDGFDEALVPWDTRDMNDPGQLILDDEMDHWLGQLGTTNVTVIVDACHSGTTTRGSGEFPRARGPSRPATGTMPTGGLMSGAEAGLNHALMAAAAPWELAYEDRSPEGMVFGQFTYHLAEVLDNARRGATTYDDVIRHVHARLGVARQTPQLEGDGAAVLFRVHAGVPQRSYAVATRRGPAAVQLDVGTIHGARSGAVFDVYGAQETSFLGTAAAQVRVDSVRETISFATVLGDGRVPNGGRAVLSRVPQGAVTLERLRLFVEPSAAEIRDSLGQFSTWLELASSEAAAHAVLRKRGDLYEIVVSGEQVAPLRGDYQAGHAGGDLARADIPRGYLGSSEALCGPLNRAYSIVGLQLIQNSSHSIRVEIRALPSSVTPPVEPARTPVDTAYVDSLVTVWGWVFVDEAAVRQTPVYLTAAVSGFTSQPFSLWPRGTAPAIALNPDQVNRPIPIMQGIRMSPVTGIETLKILAGVERFDFRSFVNRLPDCAATRSKGTRGDSWTSEDPKIEGWSTAERRVEIMVAPVHTTHRTQ